MSTAHVKVRLKTPHPKQLDFIESTAKRKVIRAGRRSGKTTGIAVKAVQEFLAGRRILYATPTQEQVERFWFEVKNALADLIELGPYRKNETTHIIERNGTEQRIRAKTAWNADTLRGDYADLLIMDEYQLMDEDAWRLVGAPMLLDKNGDAIFIYTPPSALSRSVSKAHDPLHAAKLYKKAEADTKGRWEVFHFTSHDNPYLSTDALSEIAQDMDERAYRQEIMAEDIDSVPGALWTLELIEQARVQYEPDGLQKIVAIDPAISSKEGSDETGIVTVGAGAMGYVLNDLSGRYTPEEWGRLAIAEYYRQGAAVILAEKNQGGDMVASNIYAIDPTVPVELVSATRNKYARAVPILGRWQRGEVKIVGKWPELEFQMTNWVDGMRWSPDRMDAMVHGLRALMGTGASDEHATLVYDDRQEISTY